MYDQQKKILRALRQICETEHNFGVEEICIKKSRVFPKDVSLTLPLDAKSSKSIQITALEKSVKDCTKCSLYISKRNFVFGEGELDAKIMFIGEAPGFEEDIQARPFVGAAGKLLDKIINAIGLERGQVYIANCLKCRPPGNRNPNDLEITMCYPYLWSQIEIIRPKIICALGKFAAQTLMASCELISNLRGKISDFHGIPIIATYHPAYLLRNPRDKKLVWDDMQKVMQIMGMPKIK
ncbi:MAG: uracil-DNA glycosylase [Candidatus Omnitrophota bacterium]